MYNTMQELICGFFESVDRNHIIIEHNKQGVTAYDLQVKAKKINRYLLEQKITKGTRIGVLINQRIDMVASIIGILGAAGVFVPFEEEYPAEMIKEMLQVSKIKTIIVDEEYEKYQDVFKELDIKTVDINSIYQSYSIESCDNKDIFKFELYDSEDPIYIYFTSGTTNKPKAVLGKNIGLVHFIEWESKKVNYINARVSQLTTPCHDPFLRDVFLAMNLKGTICMPESKNVLLDSKSIVEWIESSKLDIIHCTPGIFSHILSGVNNERVFNGVKYIFLAGQKINTSLIKKWYALGNDANLINLYGPTETTLAKVHYDIKPKDVDLLNIPIGKPIDDTTVYILNDNMQVCDTNEVGEIYIKTAYSSLGYVDNEEQNNKSFIKDLFGDSCDDVVYKTGDFGYLLPDGNIVCVGRKDSQIKIRGNRVELGFVEYSILSLEHIKDCVVVFNDNESNKEHIVAYIVADYAYTKAQIIDMLRKKMPDYMLPTFIVFMDKIPLNSNHKTDYKALPDPYSVVQDEAEEAVNEIQEKLIEIYKDILQLNEISIHDNFFTLGGTSLEVMSLLSGIYDEFNIEVSLEDIFNSDSILDFSEIISEKIAEEQQDIIGIKNDYTLECYEKEYTNEARYNFLKSSQKQRVIQNIYPYNSIFFKSCIYNSLFAVINHFGADELAVLVNDIILYGNIENVKATNKIEYHEIRDLENILKDMGIEMRISRDKENIIQEIIDSVDNNKPVILGVDCFYETVRTEFYKKSNWPHNILVYGYDIEKQEMIVLEHTGINNLDYKEQRLSFLDIEFAYHSNKTKFSNFEDGRYYIELSKCADYVAKDVEFYFKQYAEHYMSNYNNIINDADNILGIIDYILECTDSKEQVNRNYTNLINLLDSIIEAKYAQKYLFEKFMQFDNTLKTGSDCFDEVAKAWKLIRNVIYKTKYVDKYTPQSFKDACEKLKNIIDREKDFYLWFYKSIGGK